jgi:hypothetical protein
MPVLTGDPDQVLIGAGQLYVAPVAQADPANVAAVTGASAWREVGWTAEGSQLSFATTIEQITVAEEFYSVKQVVTNVVASVAFSMSQATSKNLQLALNIAANAANDSTMVEPVTPGDELRFKLVHITEEGALWIFRRVIQTGSLEIARAKAPAVALLPVTFGLEKPAGAEPWAVIPTAAGLI